MSKDKPLQTQRFRVGEATIVVEFTVTERDHRYLGRMSIDEPDETRSWTDLDKSEGVMNYAQYYFVCGSHHRTRTLPTDTVFEIAIASARLS